MITHVIVKKDNGKISIVTDETFSIAYITSDNKFFLDNIAATKHERFLMTGSKQDERMTA